MVTSTIKLGTSVLAELPSPRTLTQRVLALYDISGGASLCGIGSVGRIDATILAVPADAPAKLSDRLADFVRACWTSC